MENKVSTWRDLLQIRFPRKSGSEIDVYSLLSSYPHLWPVKLFLTWLAQERQLSENAF